MVRVKNANGSTVVIRRFLPSNVGSRRMPLALDPNGVPDFATAGRKITF
ncbi:MAG TPA: hypothetical protein VGL10_07585 [Gammaproteobacteria bacterium]